MNSVIYTGHVLLFIRDFLSEVGVLERAVHTGWRCVCPGTRFLLYLVYLSEIVLQMDCFCHLYFSPGCLLKGKLRTVFKIEHV